MNDGVFVVPAGYEALKSTHSAYDTRNILAKIQNETHPKFPPTHSLRACSRTCAPTHRQRLVQRDSWAQTRDWGYGIGCERRNFLTPMLRSAAVLLTRLITGVNPVWMGCSPESAGLRVYFANHGSHLDFATLWAALPHFSRERTRPVAARDYWGRTGFTRAVIGVFNGLLIAREGITRKDNPIEQMVAAMHAGHSLILFPEGTRSVNGCVGEFKPGLYHLATKVPEAELVPVYLQNLNRILPKGHLLPVPLISSVVFGPPIRPHEGESKCDFLFRAKKAVLNLAHGSSSQ